MFEENENLVEETTENVEEQATEELVDGTIDETEESEEEIEENAESVEEIEKSFTKQEVDEMIAKKLARKEARIRKEYEKKYSRLENVVNTGMGTENVDEATNKLEEFYKEKGIDIPAVNKISDKDEERLANLDADEIIEDGYDDVKEEVDRLANKGLENMSVREKAYFLKLAKFRENYETEKVFRENGITKEEINTNEFKEIMDSLNPKLSNEKKLKMYLQMRPKKEVKKIGSAKSGQTSQVKDFYTQEEISKLTEEDLDNPEVWENVRKSMTRKN